MRMPLIVTFLLWSPAVLAQESAPPTDASAVQTFVDGAKSICKSEPAQECVNLGWRFAAAAPNDGLTVSDVRTLRRRLGAWYDTHEPELPAREAASIGLGLMLADGMGIERLHAAFDSDRDGKVTQKELLADVKLDSRPLGEVLKDPAATNRTRLARRLGLPPALLGGLFG